MMQTDNRNRKVLDAGRALHTIGNTSIKTTEMTGAIGTSDWPLTLKKKQDSSEGWEPIAPKCLVMVLPKTNCRGAHRGLLR